MAEPRRTKKARKVAALIHGYSWECPEKEIILAPGLAICSFRETPIEVCYQRLCEVQGIDDGDPFQYKVYLSITEPPAEYEWDTADPLSLINRLCNVVTVITRSPVGMCRAMYSRNDFATLPETDLLFSLVGQTEFLNKPWRSITPEIATQLIASWLILEKLWCKKKSEGRIANALLYFYLAWRSHHIEHICLNLAICLEMLFAPHSNTETTHQIAFNVSRFLASEPSKREAIYTTVKTFYAARSAIVHGGIPNPNRVIDVTVEMFPIILDILHKIVVSEHLAKIFDNEQERKRLLKDYLFS